MREEIKRSSTRKKNKEGTCKHDFHPDSPPRDTTRAKQAPATAVPTPAPETRAKIITSQLSSLLHMVVLHKRTMGRYPIPKKIWNMNTMAVAPNAADWLPVERRIAVMAKQRAWPEAEIMRRGRRPKRSTVCGIAQKLGTLWHG